ncbi:fumarylacetoacetate hydrolase family protein [Paraburkholderia nodosa]|uniref:fumarylacetoacetate hydrolase family protein n=1 Tax=Paraburkholderia nodosa TaxID=392320 RepID=UPI00055912FB|nr:fumarylacetoacetate hydrolase family protein [Paraburkholderia nodosa]
MKYAVANVSSAGSMPFPVLVMDGLACALALWTGRGLRGVQSMGALMQSWDANAPILRDIADEPATRALMTSVGVPLSTLVLHAPVAPSQVYCTIANYRAQLLEAAADATRHMTAQDREDRQKTTLDSFEARRRTGEPYIAMKGTACIAGANEPLRIHEGLASLDWEVELGVVVGCRLKNVDAHEALKGVAGYCVVNDITLRDRVFRADMPNLGTDWIQSKARAGWLPTGPFLVPAWNIEDPSTLKLRLSLNGEQMQEGCVSDMIFSIGEQLAYLSSVVGLEPGDLVCTGTPAGIGTHYARYLRPGDVIEASIDGLGSQLTPCVF